MINYFTHFRSIQWIFLSSLRTSFIWFIFSSPISRVFILNSEWAFISQSQHRMFSFRLKHQNRTERKTKTSFNGCAKWMNDWSAETGCYYWNAFWPHCGYCGYWLHQNVKRITHNDDRSFCNVYYYTYKIMDAMDISMFPDAIDEATG